MVHRHAHVLLLFLVMLAFSLSAQEESLIRNRSTTPHVIDEREFYLHAVLQGQTLYSIARAYHVSIEEILRENPDLADGLRFDQVIRIPVRRPTEAAREIKSLTPQPEGEVITHKVLPRETLYGLSRQYNIPIELILYYNPDARGGLKIDQLLIIPVEAADDITGVFTEDEKTEEITPTDILPDGVKYTPVLPDGLQLYTVYPGETKYGISRQLGITIEELEELNPEIRDGLRAGQQIQIPASAEIRLTPGTSAGRDFISVVRKERPALWQELDDYCFNPQLKDEYHVALLIPFYLDELAGDAASVIRDNDLPVQEESPDSTALDVADLLDKQAEWLGSIRPNHRSFAFISYYHGVVLALDSIRQQGVDIRLHVFDVCQNTEKAYRVTTEPGFADMDLIIGPFHRQSLDIIADFGRRNQIAVVSPLLPDNRQLYGFPNLIKATSSLETMLDGVASHVARNYPQQNIIIVHNQQAGAAEIIQSFKDTLLTQVALNNHFYDSLNFARISGYYLNEALVGSSRTNVLIMPDTVSVMLNVSGSAGQEMVVPTPYNVSEVIYRAEGMDGLMKKMRKDRKNILITLISGEPFLSDYLRRLHTVRHHYDISIFGIPEWQEYASIEIDYLQNLRVHIFTPSFIDYSEKHVRDFVTRYRNQFNTEPDTDAFRAAHTAYYFFNALQFYGSDFYKCFGVLNQRTFNSPFYFERPFGDANGWENKHFFIYRIDNYRMVDVRRPIHLSNRQ